MAQTPASLACQDPSVLQRLADEFSNRHTGCGSGGFETLHFLALEFYINGVVAPLARQAARRGQDFLLIDDLARLEQLPQRLFHGGGELHHGVERDIATARFDIGKMGLRDPGHLANILLPQPELHARGAQIPSEGRTFGLAVNACHLAFHNGVSPYWSDIDIAYIKYDQCQIL